MLNKLSLSNNWRKSFAILFSFVSITLPISAQEFEPGVVDPFQSQLPVSLWTEADANSSAALLRAVTPATNPAINRLRIILTLSQSFPVLESDSSNVINSARLNMLINHGVMDAAEALAQTLNWYPPEIRSEVETIALLTTRPDRYCSRLLAKQFSEVEHGFHIYCMVRNNKWQEAIELYNETSETIEENRRITLGRFLELDAENNPILDKPWVEIPEPLDFMLDEAFGRPRGEKTMPPSYIYYAREVGSSPLSELEFTESLTRWGSLPENVLFSSYRNYARETNVHPSERSDIISKFHEMDATNLPSDFDKLLDDGIQLFSNANLLHAFASQMAPVFTKIDLAKLKPSTRNDVIRLGIMGGWSRSDWASMVPRDDFPLVIAFALRHSDVDFDDLLNTKLPTRQARIMKRSFFEKQPPIELSKAAGEEILRALDVLDNFIIFEEDEVVRSFQVLIHSGQNQFARDIAINMMFGGQTP